MDGPRPPYIEEILAELHEDARGRLKEELLPGERFLWAGRSYQGAFRPFGYVLGALMFFALTVACVSCVTFGIVGKGGPRHVSEGLFLTAVLTGLGAVGFALSLAALLKGEVGNRWNRAQQLYAVTDRRLIMRSPTFDRSGIETRTIDLGLIGRIHRIEYPDGLGAVSFRAELGSGIADVEHGGDDSTSTFKLERVAEVRRVELLLRQAVADANARVTP